jgi:hypothetical protein
MGDETDRRAGLRLDVLKAYFQAMEDGEDRPRHADLAEVCQCSTHAVGRVLRWARRAGLPVASGPRDPLPTDAERHEMLDKLKKT